MSTDIDNTTITLSGVEDPVRVTGFEPAYGSNDVYTRDGGK